MLVFFFDNTDKDGFVLSIIYSSETAEHELPFWSYISAFIWYFPSVLNVISGSILPSV